MSLGIQLSTPRTLRFSTEIFSLYVLLLLTDCLRQQTTGNFIDNSTDCCFPGFHFRKFFKKLQSEPFKIHKNQFYLYHLTQPSCHAMLCHGVRFRHSMSQISHIVIWHTQDLFELPKKKRFGEIEKINHRAFRP